MVLPDKSIRVEVEGSQVEEVLEEMGKALVSQEAELGF